MVNFGSNHVSPRSRSIERSIDLTSPSYGRGRLPVDDFNNRLIIGPITGAYKCAYPSKYHKPAYEPAALPSQVMHLLIIWIYDTFWMKKDKADTLLEFAASHSVWVKNFWFTIKSHKFALPASDLSSVWVVSLSSHYKCSYPSSWISAGFHKAAFRLHGVFSKEKIF